MVKDKHIYHENDHLTFSDEALRIIQGALRVAHEQYKEDAEATMLGTLREQFYRQAHAASSLSKELESFIG